MRQCENYSLKIPYELQLKNSFYLYFWKKISAHQNLHVILTFKMSGSSDILIYFQNTG